jgi:hypothetical protein
MYDCLQGAKVGKDRISLNCLWKIFISLAFGREIISTSSSNAALFSVSPLNRKITQPMRKHHQPRSHGSA